MTVERISKSPRPSPQHNPVSHNPFSTRCVKPGAVNYVFLSSALEQAVWQRYCQNNGWGQIIGPHGSGKSTLLQWFVSRIESSSICAVHLTIRPDDRVLPPAVYRCKSPARVIVDGFELLSWRSRCRLVKHCRRRRCGLLVSTHRPFDFPVLWKTEVRPDVASRVVRILLARHES